jgi:hypothetical protein
MCEQHTCMCDTTEEGWRPCPPSLCELPDHLPFTVESEHELIGEAEDMHGAVDGVKLNLHEGHPGPLTILP